MKPQTLPTSIEHGKLLRQLVQRKLIDYKQYFIYRTEFDEALEEPPTIADFIPCVLESGRWRVLEEPIDYVYWKEHDVRFNGFVEECKIYQTALDNVKFSGWELETVGNSLIFIHNKELGKTYYISMDSGISKSFKYYSDLTTLNLPLTERGMEYFNINI